MDLMNLKKKEICAKISEQSSVKHVEMWFHAWSYPEVKLYGNEEELLRAGWTIEKIINEYRT